MSSYLSANSFITDTISPLATTSTALALGSLDLSGQRINVAGGTVGYFIHTGSLFTIGCGNLGILNIRSGDVGFRAAVSPPYKLYHPGTFYTNQQHTCYVQTPAATSTGVGGVTTTSWLTFPTVNAGFGGVGGLYFLLVAAVSATDPASYQLQDITNHCRLWLVLVNYTTGIDCQLFSLGNSSTAYFNCTASGQASISLTVAAGNTTVYQAYFKKVL